MGERKGGGGSVVPMGTCGAERSRESPGPRRRCPPFPGDDCFNLGTENQSPGDLLVQERKSMLTNLVKGDLESAPHFPMLEDKDMNGEGQQVAGRI